MSGASFPMWVFGSVALLIAMAAFGLAQVAPGAGMVVAAGGSLLWAAFAATRAGKVRLR